MDVNKKPIIGFVGQGYIGKNYADNFEERNFRVVRYSKEKLYNRNGASIRECDIVFVAVPTPTTRNGFDASIVEEVLSLVGRGKTVVIKSTVLPGTTRRLANQHRDKVILHSPEFLTKATARHDVDYPTRTIIGVAKWTPVYVRKARAVLNLLPRGPFECIVESDESEFIKYASNCFYYTKVVFLNILYDLACDLKLNWHLVEQAIVADSMIGASHTKILHKNGRGAGGICLIKDFAAFRKFYERSGKNADAGRMLALIEKVNRKILKQSGKDVDVLREVYGGKLE